MIGPGLQPYRESALKLASARAAVAVPMLPRRPLLGRLRREWGLLHAKATMALRLVLVYRLHRGVLAPRLTLLLQLPERFRLLAELTTGRSSDSIDIR